MFIIEDENLKVPIKVWLSEREDLEDGCLEQAYHLAELPFLSGPVCLMPDTHMGKGMPIGGVVASADTVIPNAVGVDIGCGMAFTSTNLPVSELQNIQTGSGTIIQGIIGDILRSVPVGFKHHKMAQNCYTMDIAATEMEKYEKNTELLGQLEAGAFQVGTLGGGNHFIELQVDENGNLGIMIHSGSRNVGKSVCDYFHEKARELNKEWNSAIPDYYRLAYLPLETSTGQEYLHWMELAQQFAMENREKMMLAVKAIVQKWVGKYTDLSIQYSHEINCHHNYASFETHFGEEVLVHRKGATQANFNELAVIPGAMGSYSYVVEGMGNEESYCSSSHGAGRKFSRKKALSTFTAEEVIKDLKEQQVTLGKTKKADVAEESRFAYKDIHQVMSDQTDLVKPVKKLKTVGVVKG